MYLPVEIDQALGLIYPLANPDSLTGPVIYLGFFIVGFFLAFFIVRWTDKMRLADAETKAKEIQKKAEEEAEIKIQNAEIEIKKKELISKEEAEKELRTLREELHERERVLNKRDDAISIQQEQLKHQEKLNEVTQRKLAEKVQEASQKSADLDKLIQTQRQTLHQISGLSKEEATRKILSDLEESLQQESGAIIARHEKKLKEDCEDISREILLSALQRYSAAHTAEAVTSTVDIPSDEMKGRIIGREGRNIRTFESVTGVDVIIDDTPGVVIVSSFDTIRREVARLSLQKLIADGRIHPSRIEEVVVQTQEQLEKNIQKIGEAAALEVGIPNFNERIINLLGRLHYRTSYSQNVLRHSVEVAFLSGMIAEQMGLNERLARRCGLLHDIGKAADHEAEGGHPKIGADILKRYNEPREVVMAALGHHDDFRVESAYTSIVAAADAASASRPGARRETLERYIRRMEELETIACKFKGVEQAFAIQAGRELRVIVSSKDTTDEQAAKICRDIVLAFEEQLSYPGEIKVTVTRETRCVEIAK
ncbi:MAG: ribonuclease Y [Thermoguttaceae bacterium]|nr:ribonuclease Y [Thermoguttaceae bacterium]